MGSKLFKAMCVFLLVLWAYGLAYAGEVVFVVNNYSHSGPSQPSFSTVTMLRGSDLEILDNLRLSGLPDAHSAALTKDWKQLWATCPVALGITSLDHEVGNHTVECESVVERFAVAGGFYRALRQANEIGDGKRRFLVLEVEKDGPL